MKLYFSGQMSNAQILSFESVWGRKNDNEMVIFCDFSIEEIPIGFIFNKVEHEVGETIFEGCIILKAVSQQFMLPYDLIPKGHKTICKFEVLEEATKLINIIPVVEDWYYLNMNYTLSDVPN